MVSQAALDRCKTDLQSRFSIRKVWQICHIAQRSSGCNLCVEIFGALSLVHTAHPEQTIRSDIEFRGIGLHSGAEVSMRLVAAPAGSGIVFRRTDLDNFEIPANGRNVAKVSYATSLMRGSVLIDRKSVV